jgi:hypothetical protein
MSAPLSSARDPFDYHVARVLILVAAFSTGAKGRLDGLTKLAKLDFLLRYPSYLERVLHERGKPLSPALRPSPEERLALESAMIRYKYGPWDSRYYPVIGRLIGQALVEPVKGRGSVALRVTGSGREVVEAFSSTGWRVVIGRSHALKRGLDLSGANLQKLIYSTFPHALDRPWRAIIAEPAES